MNQNAAGSQDYSQERQIAHKIKVKTILDEKFVKQGGMLPSYVLHGGKKISRLNIIGAIVSKDANELFESIMVDDGSGSISVRSFEKKGIFQDFVLGDIVMIIGKIREYGGERYIIDEIVKKIDDRKLVDLRKLELKLSELHYVPEKVQEPEEAAEEEIETPLKKVFDVIRKLDSGEGADFYEVLKSSGIENGEKVIEELLKMGHIFELKPGKLKVLE
jgi:RPA family protein